MASKFIITLMALFLIAISVDAQAAEKCPPNSSPKLCGRSREKTCDYPLSYYPQPFDSSECEMECQCLAGFVRDANTQTCVKLEDCSKQLTFNIDDDKIDRKSADELVKKFFESG